MPTFGRKNFQNGELNSIPNGWVCGMMDPVTLRDIYTEGSPYIYPSNIGQEMKAAY